MLLFVGGLFLSRFDPDGIRCFKLLSSQACLIGELYDILKASSCACLVKVSNIAGINTCDTLQGTAQF